MRTTMIEAMADLLSRRTELKHHVALSVAREILMGITEAGQSIRAAAGIEPDIAGAAWRRMVQAALNDPADQAVWDRAVEASGERVWPITEAMRPAIAKAWGEEVADEIVPKKPN